MIPKRTVIQFIFILGILILTGCGITEQLSEEGLSGNETISAYSVSDNVSTDTVSSNESPNSEEIDVIELQDGLYAYITTEIHRGGFEIEGIPEWIVIRCEDPREVGFSCDSRTSSDRKIMIPNVYGTITDIREISFGFVIDYEDGDAIGEAVIPIDFYALDGNIVEPYFRWNTARVLVYNMEELNNAVEYPIEVWRETFLSNGKEYTATYSRVSPMYTEYSTEAGYLQADYKLNIQLGSETVYETKLYQMRVEYEEVHYFEDVNGDGVEDIIQINNENWYASDSVPYVFVWNPEQENYVTEGAVVSENAPRIHEYTIFNRDTQIFYNMDDYIDIYFDDIIYGVRFVDGEWKIVYELCFDNDDFVREIQYDEKGNLISDIEITRAEGMNIIDTLRNSASLNFYLYLCNGYEKEYVAVNDQFSYWRYVRKED